MVPGLFFEIVVTRKKKLKNKNSNLKTHQRGKDDRCDEIEFEDGLIHRRRKTIFFRFHCCSICLFFLCESNDIQGSKKEAVIKCYNFRLLLMEYNNNN